MKKEKFKVVQNAQTPDEEVPTEIIAQAIVKISEGFEKIRNSGLKQRALCILLRDASGVSLEQITAVLRGLEDLKRLYVR